MNKFIIKNVSFGLTKCCPEMLTFGLLLHNTEDEFWFYHSALVNDSEELAGLCIFVLNTLAIAGVEDIHLLKKKTVWVDKNGVLGFKKGRHHDFIPVYKGR